MSDSPAPLFKHDGDGEKAFKAVVELLARRKPSGPAYCPCFLNPSLHPTTLPSASQSCNAIACWMRYKRYDEFFEFIVSKTAKGNKGQYFTPRHLVEMCVRMLDPKPDELIADPACGSGGFLITALRHIRAQKGNEKVQPKLWGFDMDDRAVQIARALLVIAGVDDPKIFRLNSLVFEQRRNFFTNGDDLLTIEKVTKARSKDGGVFDVILTNPPFAGEIRERTVIESYNLGGSHRRTKVERDILFSNDVYGF